MVTLPIGLQLCSVQESAIADFEGTLRRVKAMGYDGVEFAGLYGQEPSGIKRMCQEIGLVPVSAHVGFMDLLKNPRGVISIYKEIGCMQVVIPGLSVEYLPEGSRFQEAAEGIRILGEVCRELGMELAYHNHDFEFVKINDEYLLDSFYKEIPDTLLKTQLDTCWVNTGGVDPAAYVRKYAGRMPTLHLKDFTGCRRAHLCAQTGNDGEEAQKQEDAFEFRPVGYGKQDFPAILEAACSSGVSWLIVEQDEPCLGKTRMECAGMSIEYLRSL